MVRDKSPTICGITRIVYKTTLCGIICSVNIPTGSSIFIWYFLLYIYTALYVVVFVFNWL